MEQSERDGRLEKVLTEVMGSRVRSCRALQTFIVASRNHCRAVSKSGLYAFKGSLQLLC